MRMGVAVQRHLGALSMDWLSVLAMGPAYVASQIGNITAALGGKITPSAERQIREETNAAIRKAKGTQATQQEVTAAQQEAQQTISASLESYGGSSLPEYGGSATDWVLPGIGSGAKSLLLYGGLALAAILVIPPLLSRR